ncbi:hypothetical protein [Salinarimonas soli]|uniref:Uncharacterized protein n=1 Tax=Salinarimonas soli TaxID=1638099 RepID=A0A5B2V8K1_9HYPH|nr:hypothetical protein [Salinarimonas soli]KAA2235301.1 hypothetical protein F0L46_19990 [Salinarimonas soli]
MAPKKPSDEGAVIAGPETAPPDPVAAAEYVAAMTNELAALSRRSGLDLLAYFLDIARLEALEQARRPRAAS